MMDLQAVYIRDLVRLRDVSTVPVLRVIPPTKDLRERYLTVTEVLVDQNPAPFFRSPNGDLLVTFPEGVAAESILAGGVVSLWLYSRPTGKEQFLRRVVGEDFTTEIETSVLPGVGDTWSYQPLAQDLKVDNQMLRVTGQDFRKAVTTLVNGLSVPFTVLGRTTLICSLPPKVSQVETIEVVASAANITGTSYFSFLLGKDPSTSTGVEKLMGQFIKGLLTSPGSGSFDKEYGAGLNKWIGSIPLKNNNALAAQVALKIQQLALQMTAGQLQAKLPPDEVLLSAQLLSVGISEDDPSTIEVSLSLRTLSEQELAINLLVGGVEAQAQKALAGA